MDINKIYNQDCVAGMEQMVQSGIFANLIIADPPYMISRKSNFGTMQNRKNHRTGTDLGEWDKDFDNKPWIQVSYQALLGGGSLIVFNSVQQISNIIHIAQEVGYEYKDKLVWQKTNPMPRNRDRRYVQNIELMVWFIKPGKWIFNRQDQKYESCVMQFPSESGGGFKRYHPTQKPVRLIEHLIKIHSNPGDLVLDPFMGSGTTAVAAMQQGRNFIGFEKDTNYYNIANERIGRCEGRASM